MTSKIYKMGQIKDEILNLTTSPLYQYRVENSFKPVVGEGSCEAKIIFIGEAPGKKEALTGRPFCGASGQVLDKMLTLVNLKRADVYITNIVKDRPPENRDPTPVEIDFYSSFLTRQINIIKPKIIVTLGRFAMSFILSQYGDSLSKKTITDLHGKEIKIKTSFGSLILIPFYHPAASIYNQKLKTDLKTDFLKLKKLINNYD